MISNALTSSAYAYSPDADRAGPDASVRLRDGIVRFLVLVAFLVREHWLAIRQYCAGTRPSSCYRSDLPPDSAQQPAASLPAAFGNALAWICRRRGVAPGHHDWLQPSRAIMAFGSTKNGLRPANANFAHQANVAFGGDTKSSRPGQPACGLKSCKNPSILPGAIGDIAETPAAPATALLSPPKIANAPSPTSGAGDRAPAWPVAGVLAGRALAEMFPILDQYRSSDRAAAIQGSQLSCV